MKIFYFPEFIRVDVINFLKVKYPQITVPSYKKIMKTVENPSQKTMEFLSFYCLLSYEIREEKLKNIIINLLARHGFILHQRFDHPHQLMFKVQQESR